MIVSFQQTELKLRVGEDQAFAGGMFCGFVVDVESECAESAGVGLTDGFFHGGVGDVFVVAAGINFGRRSEDGFGQAVGFAETARQLDSADRAGLLVVLPSGAREIAAHDALYGEHLRPLDEHGAAVELTEIGLEFAGKLPGVCGYEMVRDDGLEEVEPEERELGENLSFVGYSAAQNMVEGGDAVAGDEEELIVGEGVDIRTLPRAVRGRLPRSVSRRAVGMTLTVPPPGVNRD